MRGPCEKRPRVCWATRQHVKNLRWTAGLYQHGPVVHRIYRNRCLLLSYEHRSRLAARGAS